MANIYDELFRYFGYKNFRNGQENIVNALIMGQDVLCIMPTGAGKSLCYQLPALMTDGITLVISPLIALMQDQVTALKEAGIKAAYLNSTLSPFQFKKALANAVSGMYKIIYVAPERLESQEFLLSAMQMNISMIAVDEAHCVSQWGHDFRPSYLRIRAFVSALKKRPTLAAFTATATENVRYDIETLLGLKAPLKTVTGFDRPNLFFAVERLNESEKNSALLFHLKENAGKSGIVYCSTRKKVDEVCALLIKEGFTAAAYHAGMSDEDRKRAQEDFIFDNRPIMVATNAFGMGIDKSNVSFVIHYNMPKDIESYYQEAGRAGRDGTKANCILLFSKKDITTNRFLIENGSDDRCLDTLEKAHERLNAMVDYCKYDGCLRQKLLNYFGEEHPGSCGACSSCLLPMHEEDITDTANTIMRAASSIGFRLNPPMLAALLKGSNSAKKYAYSNSPYFGALGSMGKDLIETYIDKLISSGYLKKEGRYDHLRPEMLPRDGKYIILMPDAIEPEERISHKLKKTVKKQHAQTDIDSELYSILAALRSKLAQKNKVPAYIIFSNASLEDMCIKKPTTPDEFLSVSGVGMEKQRRYAKYFLPVIAGYINGDDLSEFIDKQQKAPTD